MCPFFADFGLAVVTFLQSLFVVSIDGYFPCLGSSVQRKGCWVAADFFSTAISYSSDTK